MKNKAGTQAYALFGFKLGTASKSHGIDLYTSINLAMHELHKPSPLYHLFTSVLRIPAAATLFFVPHVNHEKHAYNCVAQVPRWDNTAWKKAFV